MAGKISYFQSLPEGGKPHVFTEIITIDDFISGVKYGKWKHFIEPIRQEPDKAKRDRLKRNIPSVTIGGVFKERQQDKLIDHSGFICVDIDKFNDKSSLLSDPYTYALFQSASGGGIAVIVRVNPDKHKEAYRWLEHYYYATFGISVDPAPKNVASLRYVSYDPDIFVNTRSLQSRTKSEKARKPQSLPVILPTNAVEEMISQVVQSRIDLAPDYDSYLRLGFALASGFGEEGRTYFHQLCHISDKYHSAQADKQFDWCLSGVGKSGISVGTFYWMLKDAGIKIPKVNEKAVQVAALAKKSGRTKDGVAATLVEVQNIDPKEAQNIAEQVFDRDDIDLSKVAKDPDQLITSLVEWIRQNHPVRVNSITRMIEESGIEVNKERMNTIYLRARMCFNSKEITKDLVESIIFSDMIHEFNPVTEYIDRNRKRNSSGNIDALIRTIHTDTPNAELWIKKWLVSLIAAYEGAPVRIVLALVGGQNTGKTEWFRRLLPGALSKYYAESKLDSGKDDEILMTQKLIVMDDEMGGKSKYDEKRFKELTSKSIFSLRAPYGRYNEDFKRLAVLCGTSNDQSIINDPTGNTRILPVRVLGIDHEAYNAIDKDELMMELVRLHESGFDWQLTKDQIIDLGHVSGDYETIPFERELIQKFFKSGETGGGYSEWLTSSEIKDYIETHTAQKIGNLRRFGIELVNVLGQSQIKSRDGISSRCYCVIKNKDPKPSSDEDLP